MVAPEFRLLENSHFEDRGYETPCRVWERSLTNGYARLCIGKKVVIASRWVLEQEVGPLGELNALHRCDQRDCIRLDHLYAGSQKQNVQDAIDRDRHPLWGRRECPEHGCALEFNWGQYFCRQCRRDTQREFARKKRARAREAA